MVLLLKELGYGTALFYYPEQNHLAAGIKCPVKYSVEGSEYCFIETTAPSILSDDKNYYLGEGTLCKNPEIYLISNGISFPEKAYEYGDAKDFRNINYFSGRKNFLYPFYKIKLKTLTEKYGLKN